MKEWPASDIPGVELLSFWVSVKLIEIHTNYSIHFSIFKDPQKIYLRLKLNFEK